MESGMILVKGDISGIQDFIFNVKSDGAARELKARSFFIKLLIETSMQSILDKFDVDLQNYPNSKISTSGGSFILKLPRSTDTESKLFEVQSNFTKALQATGLNISFAFVGYETAQYNKCLIALNHENRKAKYCYYSHDRSYFEPFQKTALSNNWMVIYELISHKNAFKIEKSNTIGLKLSNISIELAGYKITFNNKGEGSQLENYLESLIPRNEFGSIKTFEVLATDDKKIGDERNGNCRIIVNGGRNGIEKLGILAMDVDGLGTYLENIQSETAHKEIDQRLSTFFNLTLRSLINNAALNYRSKCNTNIPLFGDKIYSVTAGGDDSFFVGKWNTILDFASKINQEFTMEFSRESLTISAGLVIVDSKFPVVRFAEKVDHALKKAKYGYNTKGNLCILNEVIPWSFLPEIERRRQKLYHYLQSGLLTKGILEQARQNIQGVRNFEAFDLEDFWKLSYSLREMDSANSKEIIGWLKKDIEESILAQSPLEKKIYRLRLSLAARLAEFDKRK